jgi:hypothetical protein
MLSSQIEARLRLPAPDEPAVLPALVLPRLDVGQPEPWRVRFGAGVGDARDGDLRLAFVAALVALAALAAIIGGALRQDRQPTDRYRFEGNGFSLEWPADWKQLVSGDLWLEDGTEASLLAAQVVTIVSSRELAGCESVTPGPTIPGPVRTGEPAPSGAPFVPQPDEMMMCARSAELPPDAVRLTVVTGQVPDLFSEPNALNSVDWTEPVGDYTALLVVDGPEEVRAPGVDEIRTWLLAVPTAVGSVVRLRAELSGPDLDAGRRAAGAVVSSFQFSTPTQALDPQTRDDAVAIGLNTVHERLLAQTGSDFVLACFPTTSDTRDVVIETGPGGPLPEPIEMSCSTYITETPDHLWKVTLEAYQLLGGPNADLVWQYWLYLDAKGQIVAEQGGAVAPSSEPGPAAP